MTDPVAAKAAARISAFARREAAHHTAGPGASELLSSVIASYRGVPLSGYMAIRTEIDPLPAMAEAAAHGPVGVPVVQGLGMPLRFSRWEPGMVMKNGPFGAPVPAADLFFEPEILIVPLVAFTRAGSRLGYGGGFYDRTLAGLRAKRPTVAIGFAFAAQEDPDLPLDVNDQPLDMVVTEREIIEISQ